MRSGTQVDTVRQKLNLLEAELIDVKNMYKIPIQRGYQGKITSEEAVAHLNQEVFTIWSFLQRYIDENITGVVAVIGEPDRDLTIKLD